MEVKILVALLENKVEAHLDQAIKAFQQLEAQKLNQLATNGGWSIAQCLAHLNTYGDYYLPKIEHAIDSATITTSKEFVSGWLGKYFTGMMDPDRAQKKYKAMKMHHPPSSLDAHQTVAKFIDQQEKLIVLLKRCENKDLASVKVATSINKLIKLKLGDALQFLIMHNERHIRQAIRNL